MKRVLVTGAGGQLGRSLQDARSDHPNLIFRFAGKGDLDITAPEQIQAVFESFQPDYCINCAAFTKVEEAERRSAPAIAVNVDGVRNLVHASEAAGTTLIHISTDYVFDGKKAGGYTPEDTPNPINIYGKTKLKGEQIIQSAMERFFIIRTSWLYSKQYGPNFYRTILAKAEKGEKLTVTDAQSGCPTDAANLAEHILNLIEADHQAYGLSHFTDGEAMTWYDFAARILEEHQLEQRAKLVRAADYRTIAKRPVNSVLSDS